MKHLTRILFLGLFCLLLTACQKECVPEYRSEITRAPTCTQEGIETFTCIKCNSSFTKPIAMLEHAYGTGVVQTEATCTQEGQMRYECADCNAIKQEPIAKLPHTLAEPTVTREPNCSQEGECTGNCTVCGAENVTEKIPVNDAHVFENTVVREATCTDPGEGLDTCTLCGHTQSCQYDYKPHTYGQAETITSPTCTKDGTAKAACSVCGQTEDRKIPATGHKWTGATCQKAATCSVCSATGSKAKHNYETVSTKGSPDSQYFAQEVSKRCKTCGSEKTLYYVGKTEFDLEAVRDTLEAYARSYGFTKIGYTIDDSIIDSRKGYKCFEVFKVDWYKEPVDYLVSLGKLLIDTQYKAAKGYGLDKYELQLTVTYGASASVGTGMFYVHVARYELI